MFSSLISSFNSSSSVAPSLKISSNIFNVEENDWTIIDNINRLKKFKNEKYLIFNLMDDARDFETIFKNCEYALFTNCDKNFIYSWMDPLILPNVKEIYLDNDVSQPEVFEWWIYKK